MTLDILKKTILILFCFILAISFAQQNEISTNFETKIHKGVGLYNSRLYTSAQKLFVEVSKNSLKESNVKAKADYYDALCAIKLEQTSPEKKVLAFVKKYPNSTLKQKAYYNIGNYYYSNQKAAHALEWYSKVNPEYLTQEQINEMNFKMGYMLLITKFYAEAKEKFGTLLGSEEYGNDSRYYHGYIAHRQENYEEANENYAQLANNASVQDGSNYMILDMAFKNGEFEKAIELGEKVLSKHTKDKKGDKSDILKIIGESYFNLKKYKECIPYLEQYKEERGKWNNTNLYYLGYAYYQQNNFEKAVSYFTKIISGNNIISQNAYYHLGVCYIKLNKKSEALNAFKNASEMPFENKVKKDAALNYTKLSYEEGNPYNSISNTLKEYITEYPDSEESASLKELLITSYLHERDFESALKYLSTKNTSEDITLSMEVSLHRAIQLFQEKEYRRAMPYFLIASSAENPKIKNKALYWMAESQYLIGKYKNAVIDFLKVDKTANLEKFKNIDYNIAYSYFKMNDYQNAKIFFNKFINLEDIDKDMKDDAIKRLGDSYYATRNYASAIKNYNIIIESSGSGADYAMYQRAMSNGLITKKEDKLNDLQKLITDYPQSIYIDDAMFQIATSYSALKKDTEAAPYLDKILKEYPNSSYTPSVLLRIGLDSYRRKDYTNAITNFKEVVSKYPSSQEAKQAITNIRNVYIDKGDIEPYINWVKTIPNLNISKREIDDSSFQAAQNIYFNDDFTTAVLSLKSYIGRFPKGAHLLNANYYLGESFFNLKQKERAIPYYKYVMEKEKNDFSEDVTEKLAQIYIYLNEWDKAIPVLEKLQKEANLDHNLLFAKNNLMKSYFEKKDYVKAKEFSSQVLQSSKLDQSIEEDAKLIIARIAIIEKDYTTAREYYEVLDQTAQKEVKAETLYHKALFLNQDEAYKKSNTEIQNLISGYASYKYWGVKSYLIMAKNHSALGDSYQASYILENIVKNFSQYKGLVEQAQNGLNKIKNKVSRENESINSNMGGK